MLIVSVVMTAAACAVGAAIAGRARLVAIPLGLGMWVITGFADASLGHHARLIDWESLSWQPPWPGPPRTPVRRTAMTAGPRTRPSRRVNFSNPGNPDLCRESG